jgi:hypothetical protein
MEGPQGCVQSAAAAVAAASHVAGSGHQRAHVPLYSGLSQFEATTGAIRSIDKLPLQLMIPTMCRRQ